MKEALEIETTKDDGSMELTLKFRQLRRFSQIRLNNLGFSKELYIQLKTQLISSQPAIRGIDSAEKFNN